MKKIGIIGLWHLGCVLSAAWSKLGHTVAGYDSEGTVVEGLQNGEPPLFEPGLEESLRKAAGEGTLSFSSDVSSLADCDFVFLSHDTPVLDDDSSDTAILKDAIRDMGSVMKDGAILIVSSQSPVGFCAELRESLKQLNPTLELAYSPENLRLGEAIECYLNPGRIILGTADDEVEKKCVELFDSIPGEILAMGLESAEMVKHGINSFLSTSIVFANQMADLCESTGARIDDVVRGMKSDPRIGEKAYLAPGIGFSGGTLGRDLKVLDSVNHDTGVGAELFGKVHELNIVRKNTIVRRVERIMSVLDGRNISILGMTYKPGTSTLRRSLPLEIVGLLAKHCCRLKAYDPKADYSEVEGDKKFEVSASIEDAAKDADMLLLLTDWPEFREYDWKEIPSLMNRPVFFDARNFLEEETMKEIGFEYYSIGRS